MPSGLPDTDVLLTRISQGDADARQQLLQRHRTRLRQMIGLHLDRRLAGRVDPSDIVQETLADADRKLPAYVRVRPLPFYPWLRRLALERLSKAHRRHLHTDKRSAAREEPGILNLPDESAVLLASRLIDPGSSPSQQLLRAEQREQIQAALARLAPRDREVLLLRYLEELSTRDIAAVLDISEGAVKVRHLRALQRLRKHLDLDTEEGPTWS